MIHVDRSKVPVPAWWNGPDFRRFLDAWAKFHDAGGTRVQQRRMVKTADAGDLESWRRRALPALLEGFGGKCAYTEEPIDEKTGTVVFHRPEADAAGFDGEVWPQHYWWLVADWSNWYPASRAVHSIKGTTFPVVGERSLLPQEPGMPPQKWIDRHRDLGLLLDPCRDHPAWYLEFRNDGTVHPREHPSPSVQRRYDGQSRGEITIKVLGLDRPELVDLRQSHGTEFGGTLTFLMIADGDQEDFVQRGLLQPRPFRASTDQVLGRSMRSRLPSKLEDFDDVAFVHALALRIPEVMAAEIAFDGAPPTSRPVAREVWKGVRRVFTREWPELDDEGFIALIEGRWHPSHDEALTLGVEPNLEAGAARGSEVTEKAGTAVERSARIEHIEIRNFKAIEHLELDLSAEPVALPAPFDPSGAPAEETPSAVRWTALLGENGSGKSCWLQALGLALAADRLDDLLVTAKLDWSRMLRRGAKRGRVLVRLIGGSRLDLRFNANRHWWVGPDGKKLGEPPRMAAYIRGYGATRLLEGGPVDAADGAAAQVRLANLFDPRAPVLDAEQWLLALEEGDFNVAAVTLSGFLQDDRRPLSADPAAPDQPPLMTREGGEVLVGGDPLSYLSDGYRAVITLVCDIMAGLGAGLSDLRNATGVVLIDELGSHLHPRWKMEITGRLRRELPNVQFFVSTHEPLCLRGMFKNEVVRVVKRQPPHEPGEPFPPGKVEYSVIDRSPSDYRVDQLLTSEFFGLDTTIDPDLDRRFQAYYRLLAMTPEERAAKGLEGRMLELKTDIQSRTQPVLGFTRRDQLVYEAIDKLLADERGMTPEEKQARRKATLHRIQEIWKARGTVGGAGATGRVSGQGRGREPRG